MLLLCSCFHLHPPAAALGDFTAVNQDEGLQKHLTLIFPLLHLSPRQQLLPNSTRSDRTDRFWPLDKTAFLGQYTYAISSSLESAPSQVCVNYWVQNVKMYTCVTQKLQHLELKQQHLKPGKK